MGTLARYTLIAAVLIGLGMMSMGTFFVVKGLDAKTEIEMALVKERVVTSNDAPIPGVMVNDAPTARAQQDAIEAHTYGRWGPYSEMDREDPNRDSYLKGLTLRNALNMAVMGFGVADLAIGTGVVTVVLGLAMSGFALTVLSIVTAPAAERRRTPILVPVAGPADD